tara:strand:- start:118 stop:513 length:396 start_codon:yes stop_codon:yes gene_type:complete
MNTYQKLIEYQETRYGEFKVMDKEKYEKKKRKYHAPKDEFWEWFLGPAAVKDRYQESIEANKKSKSENKEFSSSFSPRLCKSCNRVWDRPIPGRNMKLEYYEDFPTYGMRRGNCPPCKRSNDDNNRSNKRV